MTGNTRTVFILVRDDMTKMARTTVAKRERELTMKLVATAVMVSLTSRSNSDC